ncbi:MAG: quinolinate synthase NadA [Ignavibacteria bacterium]|nr:quinolinate synthase NadA [Ignavibacteria bacterium]
MNARDVTKIAEEIKELKRKKNALLLAHNYQLPEVQDIADFVGDSLGLSHRAANVEADTIIFCGVHFMAETASIIAPEKKVLIPDLEAGCSLAATVDVESLRTWKKKHPEAVVVSYVNTTAAVKAESDYCCTSGNAVKVVNSIPRDREILFLPDMFLGAFVARETGRDLHIWPGECHVHVGISPQDVETMRKNKPEAEVLIHPECGCVSQTMYYSTEQPQQKEHTHILSTEGMTRFVRNSGADEFVIATEIGILHRLHKENPTKTFYPTNPHASCMYMKMITLEKVLASLRHDIFLVRVDPVTASKAKKAIDRMLEIS